MAQITAALAYLNTQPRINYSAAAKRYNVSRLTLYRRHTGKNGSREDAASEHHQLLNNVQEDTLLRYIDELTHRSLPPTTQIVKNLAEEMLGRPVGINWASQFVTRHLDRISSIYLNRINKNRTSATNPKVFAYYFALVCVISRYCGCYC